MANEEEESALGKGGKGRLGTEPGAKERLRKLGSARWFIFRNKQVNKKKQAGGSTRACNIQQLSDE